MSSADMSALIGARYGRLLKFITCPHCWHRFEACDIVWVAKHSDLRGDTVLGLDHFVRFLPTRFNVAGEALDARGMPCQQLACPRCHLVIPRVFLKLEPLIFSLVGVPFSGKTYFLTAMTWELARIFPSRFALAFSGVDASANYTLNEYQKTLFMQEDQRAAVGIDKTQLDSVSHYDSTNLEGQPVLLPRPFLFSMRPLKEHPKAPDAENVGRIICLYDNAGEHFLPGQDTALAPGTQHMSRSKVMMFLYDPVQDPRIRQKCKEVSSDPQLFGAIPTQLQSTILGEAAMRVRQYANIPPNKKLDQPLMVLVSKADIWEKLIAEDFSTEPYVDPPSPGSGRMSLVDAVRVKKVSAKIRSWLAGHAPELVATAEDSFKQVMYIPISPLGCSPKTQDGSKLLLVESGRIRPHWVTVPIAYAFATWATGLVASKVS